jgi:formamidopyrimidine-DNA glycosylase
MPELPDVTVYVEALSARIAGRTLEGIAVRAPFLLRTVEPPLSSAEGRTVREVRRIGKRIAIGLEGDLWLALHLMIAGRLQWRDPGSKPPARAIAVITFDQGTLYVTEAGSRHRAQMHLVAGNAGLRALDPGGLEVLEADAAAFARVLQSANHTLKRALTDPRLFSGIGNAYSDEILFHAGLSPVALTQKLAPEEVERLYRATRETLAEWTVRLRAEAAGAFPEKVTAFRPGMAVHGRYGLPCPRCGSRIQRIRYASNETNYCPHCQTGGRLLADRALSRLLREDWPRTPEELEDLKRPQT